MKILQINAVGQEKSTGRTCLELAQYLNNTQEHSCYTAFSLGTVDEYGYRIGGTLRAKIHGLLSRLTGRQAHFSAHDTAKFLTYIRRLQPDVVHLRNLHANFIHFPMLMAFLAKEDIPTVVTLHDCWFFTGKCCHYTVAGCTQWQTGCRVCPRLRRDNISWFIDATEELWHEKKRLFEAIPRLAVTGVSQWVVDEAQKSFLTCAKEITKIYNWVDLETFVPRESVGHIKKKYMFEGKKIVLGVASNWNRGKRLQDYLTLAQQLGDAYVVCLVGAVSGNIRCPKNVRHIPEINSTEELSEIYSAADVFVTLSAEETFGKVSAEALACGTPVICYDSTANRELVGEGCGAVHTLGDLDAVEASVRIICTKGKDAYSAACRAFAEANFRKEDRILDYLNLYQRIQT